MAHLMRCGQLGADAVEKHQETLLEIVRPVRPEEIPDVYDCESELLLDGSDDGSGLEPSQR